LVDTGATLSVIPEKLSEELKIIATDKDVVETDAGLLEIKKGVEIITINGKEAIQNIIISDIVDKDLIGVTILEIMALKIDPIKQKLIERKILLYKILKIRK